MRSSFNFQVKQDFQDFSPVILFIIIFNKLFNKLILGVEAVLKYFLDRKSRSLRIETLGPE